MSLLRASSRVRRSASVLLTRSWESREVFLVLRSLKTPAFPGTHVFPGGKVDPEDHDLSVRGQRLDIEPEVYVAAARELFEEVGVLVVRRPEAPEAPWIPPADSLAPLRRELLEGSRSFRGILEELGVEVDGQALIPLGELTTPPFHPRRFCNRFFLGILPEGQEPEVWPGELESGAWFDPTEAAAAFQRGEILISPPILLLCERWGDRSAQEAEEDLRAFSDEKNRGQPIRIRFSPEVLLFPGKAPTLPPATHTNTYLVGAERMLCVDPATDDPEDQARLLQLLDELAAEGRHLEAVVLTHQHPDHHPATQLVQDHTGAPLWGHAITAKHLPHLHFDRLLEDGDTVELGSGGRVRFVHTPGHAAGHLALFQEKYRALIAGDMVSTASTIVVDPHDEGDMAAYLASLEKLRDLDAQVLHPAHGDPFPDANLLLTRFLEHRLDRERKTLEALGAEEQTLSELVATVYADTRPEAWTIAERSLEAGLIKLEREGLARRGEHGWARG